MSFGGGVNTSKGSGSQQSQSYLDPDFKAGLLNNIGATQQYAAGYTPFSGQLVAPHNTNQTNYQDLLRNLTGQNIGASTLQSAVTQAQGAGSYTPQTVNYNPFSAPKLGAASQINPNSIGMVTGRGPSGADIQRYMDPNVNNVVNTTLADLNRQREIQQNANAGQATMAGAFGGSGAALQSAETNRNADQVAAQTDASLRSAAYGQALGAAQTDSARQLAAGQSNQSTQLAVGNTNANLGEQTSLGQGQIDLSTLMQNSALGLQAQQSNQQAGLTGAQLGLSSAQLLSNLGGQQQAQAATNAGFTGQAGDLQQQQAQNVLSANRDQFQQNFTNQQQLRALINSALGLGGNPVLSNSSGQQSNSSFGINAGPK